MFGFMLYPIAGRIRSRSNREMSSPTRGCASIYANHSLLRLTCVITCVQLWTSVFCAKVFVKGITYTASVAKRSPTNFLIVFSTKGFLGSYSNAEEYAKFWNVFGAVLKEGLYEDFQNREDLLDVVRFKSTAGDELISLKDYVGRMKNGQDGIYYITGDNAANLKGSPQLEGFLAKGIEVLLLTDPIDEFWIPNVGQFEGKSFKSVGEAGADLSSIDGESAKKEETEAAAESVKGLVEKLKATLGADVADVRASTRLTGSPACLVADTGGMSLHLARMLKQHGEGPDLATRKVLEVNPAHGLIKRLDTLDGEAFADGARLLLDQARIVEGEAIPDPIAFARRLSAVMERGLG